MGILEPSARGSFLQIVSMSMRIICPFFITRNNFEIVQARYSSSLRIMDFEHDCDGRSATDHHHLLGPSLPWGGPPCILPKCIRARAQLSYCARRCLHFSQGRGSQQSIRVIYCTSWYSWSCCTSWSQKSSKAVQVNFLLETSIKRLKRDPFLWCSHQTLEVPPRLHARHIWTHVCLDNVANHVGHGN